MGTIAAISTPRAQGGISVIRISGEGALAVADKIFTGRKPSAMDGYTCAYGYIAVDGDKIDDVILTVFRAPHSYTGEDVVEISCHGGIYVSERILSLVFSNGAVPARAGEFTERAFLNGKIGLTEAEAVMDVISAQGRAHLRRAGNVKNGSMHRLISGYSERLVKLLGNISAWIDYPEEDIEGLSDDEIRSELEDIRRGLKKLSDSYENSRIIKNGIDTVIAGKPNVGKSTLMNAMSGCERSIVTSQAGTTRDIIEESVRVGDIVLRLSDTAGIRSSEDIVEQAGIDRAVKKMGNADLIIAVFDNSSELDDEDRRIIELCADAQGKKIACVNKSDEENVLDTGQLTGFDGIVNISAANHDISSLESLLCDMFIGEDTADEVLVNERQKQCLDKALSLVDEAETAVGSVTLDAVNIVLDEALDALLELDGERVSDKVVSEVFSHFCVGK